MSRVPWHLFKDRQPRAHLVAAVLRAAPTAADPDPREAQGVLVRLVRAQRPASYYATTVVREAGRPEVNLAFEDKGDARKLADAVEAKATTNRAGRLNGHSSWRARRLPLWQPRLRRQGYVESNCRRIDRDYLVAFGGGRGPRSRVGIDQPAQESFTKAPRHK
jgi:hypothetical protein